MPGTTDMQLPLARAQAKELREVILLIQRPFPLDRAIFTSAYAIWGLGMFFNLLFGAW